jgi:SAM-dependent methyltransferase
MTILEHRPEQFWVDMDGLYGDESIDLTPQRPVYEKLVETILRLSPTRVLDVGCNTGRLGNLLKAAGYAGAYKGVDSNPQAVAVAQERGLDVEEGNLRWWDIRKNTQHLVVMKDVLEHLETPSLLANVLNVGREWVIISSFIPWVKQGGRLEQTPDGYYMNVYDIDEIMDIADKAGWQIHMIEFVKDLDDRDNQITTFIRKPKGS